MRVFRRVIVGPGKGREMRTAACIMAVTAVMAVSPDGKHLASGHFSSILRLWDVATGKELVMLGGHITSVRSVAFSPDGKHLASGSRDGTIKIWYMPK